MGIEEDIEPDTAGDLAEFTVTPEALAMIRSIREEAGMPLRIVAEGGCCGPQYRLFFDRWRPSDIACRQEDLIVVFDPPTYHVTRQGTLEYVRKENSEGFVVSGRKPDCSSCGVDHR